MSVNVTMDDAVEDLSFADTAGDNQLDAQWTNVLPNGQTPGQQPRADGTPDHLALKFTFFTPKNSDAMGGFCLIFHGDTGKTVQQTLWLTRKEGSTIDFKPDEPWQKFVRLLMKLGPYDRVWGDQLNALLPDIIPETERVDVFNEVMIAPESEGSRRKLMHMKGEVRRGFERATHSFLEVDCDVELLTRKELEAVGLLQPTEGEQTESDIKKDSEQEERSFNGTIIHCTPVIDPVWGKASSTIVPGDLVEVEIEEHMGASGLVKKFLETTNQTPIFPVEEISVRDGRTRIFLRINEEIIGLITLTKDLRLRTKQTFVDKESERTAIDDLVFFGALAVALVGLLLTLRYLLF